MLAEILLFLALHLPWFALLGAAIYVVARAALHLHREDRRG